MKIFLVKNAGLRTFDYVLVEFEKTKSLSNKLRKNAPAQAAVTVAPPAQVSHV